MKPLGGGAFGSLVSLLQNINSTIPQGNGWRVDMNNGSASVASFAVYSVCGKVGGWKVVSGPSVSNPANLQAFASVSCPLTGRGVQLLVIGGGVFSSSASTAVNVNSTFPLNSTEWADFENNATASDVSITPYAVCAKP